jgi:hypothetical protein
VSGGTRFGVGFSSLDRSRFFVSFTGFLWEPLEEFVAAVYRSNPFPNLRGLCDLHAMLLFPHRH